MPICGADCPPGVRIPTEDADAWLWCPDHRWVYDKIAIAVSGASTMRPIAGSKLVGLAAVRTRAS